MNETIKFIDKLIKEYKESKNNFTRYSKTYPNDEVFSNCVKKREQQIQTLEQIKYELEAWEIVKHNIYKRKMGEERYIQVMGGAYNEGDCWTSGINPYETIKKALEVKDE